MSIVWGRIDFEWIAGGSDGSLRGCNVDRQGVCSDIRNRIWLRRAGQFVCIKHVVSRCDGHTCVGRVQVFDRQDTAHIDINGRTPCTERPKVQWQLATEKHIASHRTGHVASDSKFDRIGRFTHVFGGVQISGRRGQLPVIRGRVRQCIKNRTSRIQLNRGLRFKLSNVQVTVCRHHFQRATSEGTLDR